MRTLILCILLASACGKEEAPSYSHAEPDEVNAQTCVLCHACGTDGTGAVSGSAPSPGKTHAGCVICHADDPPIHNDDLGSNWEKSCTPPLANCSGCHTGGLTSTTVAGVNDGCRRCHDAD